MLRLVKNPEARLREPLAKRCRCARWFEIWFGSFHAACGRESWQASCWRGSWRASRACINAYVNPRSKVCGYGQKSDTDSLRSMWPRFHAQPSFRSLWSRARRSLGGRETAHVGVASGGSAGVSSVQSKREQEGAQEWERDGVLHARRPLQGAHRWRIEVNMSESACLQGPSNLQGPSMWERRR